jgi:hypothetical protein
MPGWVTGVGELADVAPDVEVAVFVTVAVET